MNRFGPFLSFQRTALRGAALVIVLLLLSLVTVLVIAFSDLIKRESRVSSLGEGSYRAETHAHYALNVAMDKLEEALAPFDDPFNPTSPDPTNPSATGPDSFWALAPGLILHYPLGKTTDPYPVPVRRYPLHSGAPFDAAGDLLPDDEVVDLNQRLPSGERPIDDTLPDGQKMAVAWQPILQNPGEAASDTNRLVGRYAFWIDDEGAKVNLNTADGRYPYDGAQSYGPGTPTEVNLEALAAATPTLTAAARDALAARALAGGLTVPGEAAQVPGVPAAFPTTNRFFLTTYSRSPEFNLFNEPRIQLVPTNMDHLGLEASDTVPIGGGDTAGMFEGLFGLNGRMKAGNLLSQTPMRSIYPAPRQLSGSWQTRWFACPRIATGPDTHRTDFGSLVPRTKSSAVWRRGESQSLAMADLALQVAGYLNGTTARGTSIEWPFPDGSYLGKYNQRQLDSIVVQMLDMSRMSVPQGRGNYSNVRHKRDINPTLAPFGILGNQPVSGLGRSPLLTEFFVELSAEQRFSATDDSLLGLDLQGGWYLEMYYPMGALHPNRFYEQGGYTIFAGHYELGHFPVDGENPYPKLLNSPDAPDTVDRPAYTPTKPSKTLPETYWMDNYLIARDQNGEPAGIDFWGNPSLRNDPDQVRAEQFRLPPKTARYRGTGPVSSTATPMLQFPLKFDYYGNTNTIPNRPAGGMPPGWYAVVRNDSHRYWYPSRDPVHGKDPVTEIRFSGGLCAWLNYFGINSRGMVDFFPIESLKGSAQAGSATAMFSADAPLVSDLVPLPEVTVTPGAPAVIHGYVRDPWVNKNIGDWIVAANREHVTMGLEKFANDAWTGICHTEPNEGADDLAANWMARDYNDIANNRWGNWAHQASFPSVGILHYIRTKMMPDTGTNAGVPFRCLSFAPIAPSPAPTGPLADSQKGIPDWAMLDLFTVPQGIWRKPVSPWSTPASINWSFDRFFGGDYQLLTYGGATTGKININGAVLYPWADAKEPEQRLPFRLKPLQSVLMGLRYNRDGKIVMDNDRNVTNLEGPISLSASETVARSIAETIEKDGPFFLPGRLCDVPEIAALGATVNPTRNDVVAQALGNLTTQGNVFSIWVASQAITKARSNRKNGELEPGDEILSTRRMRFIVERYLDLGADGVPGNAGNPGRDGVVGTPDDPVDAANNPSNPKFKYRVLYAQEIF